MKEETNCKIDVSYSPVARKYRNVEISGDVNNIVYAVERMHFIIAKNLSNDKVSDLNDDKIFTNKLNNQSEFSNYDETDIKSVNNINNNTNNNSYNHYKNQDKNCFNTSDNFTKLDHKKERYTTDYNLESAIKELKSDKETTNVERDIRDELLINTPVKNNNDDNINNTSFSYDKNEKVNELLKDNNTKAYESKMSCVKSSDNKPYLKLNDCKLISLVRFIKNNSYDITSNNDNLDQYVNNNNLKDFKFVLNSSVDLMFPSYVIDKLNNNYSSFIKTIEKELSLIIKIDKITVNKCEKSVINITGELEKISKTIIIIKNALSLI